VIKSSKSYCRYAVLMFISKSPLQGSDFGLFLEVEGWVGDENELYGIVFNDEFCIIF
jgi:hypothetical protein